MLRSILCAITALAALAPSAAAESRFTLPGSHGYMVLDHATGNFSAQEGDGGAAWRFTPAFRLESELGYAKGALDRSLNVHLDVDLGSLFVPFVGGGFAQPRDEFGGRDGADLLLQAEAGLGVRLGALTIEPAYRYVWLDNGFAGPGESERHIFKLGARLGF